jgi:hypothetical protein
MGNNQSCPDMSLYTKTSDIKTGPDMSLYMKKSQCRFTVEEVKPEELKLEASLNVANPMSNMKVGKIEFNCSANYPKLEYDNGDHQLDWMTINQLDECLKADHCVIREGGMQSMTDRLTPTNHV